MNDRARIWALLGHRRGDNNQLLALAEGLGMAFETRTLSYRWFARPWMRLFSVGTGHLTRASKRFLLPPWPDVVIGIGRRSVPVALWIRAMSGGRTKVVRLGHPRAANSNFDLVVTTAQYPVTDGDNVLKLPLAMNRFARPPKPTESERAMIAPLPRPHRLLSLGGTAPMWRLDLDALERALRLLTAKDDGTLLVISSPRTPREAIERVKACPGAVLLDGAVRYPVALADADEHYVTADSVSMISEAVMTAKPVGLIAVAKDARGQRALKGDPKSTGVRDIRRFWSGIEELGLAGPAHSPRSGKWNDPVATAVAVVKNLLRR